MSLPSVGGLAEVPALELRRLLDCVDVASATEGVDDLRGPLVATRETLYSDSDDALLIRLLFCGSVEDTGDVRRVLGGAFDGLLEHGPHGVRFPFHLRQAGGVWLLSDYLGSDGDAVMGAGETTAILYRAGRSPVASALDLGCGAGTIALLLASECGRVVGTDVNARAVEMARFNAALNGIGNAEFRAGDMYAPVAGERFDLILSQPPYYPARGPHAVFLHGGAVGDELSHAVVAGLPAHLTEGGRAVLFTSWPEGREARVPDGFQAVELSTNRREVHGTRQSLNVFRRGSPAWLGRRSVPADAWGFVRPERVDAVFAAEEVLRSGLAGARLRLTPGTRVFDEGGQLLLTGAPESLIGMAPVEEAMWRVMESVDRTGRVSEGQAEIAAFALRRGWLEVA